MDRAGAIKEVAWYRSLVRRKVREWGLSLNRDEEELLVGNMDDVARLSEEQMQYKPYKSGYYIGQLDEDGLRHGWGVMTHTTKNPDRWVMQAGQWCDERPIGSHTLYDSDSPKRKHFLASVRFSGERKREAGMIELSLSERGVSYLKRKYRRYEGFSLSTLAVGLVFIFILSFVLTRRFKLSLIIIVLIAVFYTIGALRERQ